MLAFSHPFLSSSGHHGRELPNWTYKPMRPFMDSLWDAGATVLVTAHDHHFEQFNRQNRAGQAAKAGERGVRSFIVGTGGAALYSVPDTKRHSLSEYFDNKAVGVLKLELYRNRYKWSFVQAAGNPVTLPINEESCNER